MGGVANTISLIIPANSKSYVINNKVSANTTASDIVDNWFTGSQSEYISLFKLDIKADGFKLRQNAAGSNANGSAYVYMAFAEQPGGVTPFQTSSNAR